MRLFVALEAPPPAVREQVLEAVTPWRDDDRMAWTRPEGWHLTLAFLGEVDDDRLAPVVAAVEAGVAAAEIRPTALTTGAVTTLGRGALAVEVADDPSGALDGLGRAIQDALAAVDLPVTPRPVRPHLTLGRARRRRPVPADLVEEVRVPAVSWVADTVAVVRSILGKGPAAYEIQATVPLLAS